MGKTHTGRGDSSGVSVNRDTEHSPKAFIIIIIIILHLCSQCPPGKSLQYRERKQKRWRDKLKVRQVDGWSLVRKGGLGSTCRRHHFRAHELPGVPIRHVKLINLILLIMQVHGPIPRFHANGLQSSGKVDLYAGEDNQEPSEHHIL